MCKLDMIVFRINRDLHLNRIVEVIKSIWHRDVDIEFWECYCFLIQDFVTPLSIEYRCTLRCFPGLRGNTRRIRRMGRCCTRY